MRFIILLSIVAVAVAQKGYDVDLSGFHVEDVAANPENLKSLLNCFIDQGPCVGAAAELKKNVRDAIETACIKCNDGQKHIANVLMKAFEQHIPEDYKKLKQFYDPNGTRLPALAAASADY